MRPATKPSHSEVAMVKAAPLAMTSAFERIPSASRGNCWIEFWTIIAMKNIASPNTNSDHFVLLKPKNYIVVQASKPPSIGNGRRYMAITPFP